MLFSKINRLKKFQLIYSAIDEDQKGPTPFKPARLKAIAARHKKGGFTRRNQNGLTLNFRCPKELISNSMISNSMELRSPPRLYGAVPECAAGRRGKSLHAC